MKFPFPLGELLTDLVLDALEKMVPFKSGSASRMFAFIGLLTALGSAKLLAAVPVISSAATATGQVGVAFSYQITASNSPTSFSATGLPAGLSVSTTTGLISGTPTTAATSSVTLKATNSSGTGTKTLTLTVNPAKPVITSATTASGQTGVAFSYQITASNSPTSFAASPLPAGLSVSTTTGLISGTPTAVGATNVSLTATNAGGTSTAVTLKITVTLGKPVISSATTATGQVGTAFSYQITASNSPTSFAASPLPAGVTVSTTSGLISGTPTAAGTTSVSLTATNATGTSTAVTLTITVNPAKPVITSATTASGQTGTAFSYQITASNSPTSFAASPLPAGLSVSTSTGLISGTPTATGTTNVSLTATNAGGTSTAVTLTITITLGKPVITSATTATGQVGTAFSYQITASNTPTSFSATGLPAGLSVSTTTGLISGTPTAAAASSVTINAINATGTGTATLTLTVNPAKPVITSAATASGQTGVAFSYQITASNSPTSFAASPLPAGLSVNTTTGLISGTPTTAGTTNVSLTATNAGGTSTAVTLKITITLGKPVITSATTATGQVGVAFSYQITASNSPTSFAASPLPAGVTVSTTTGLISGTPTAAGTTSVSLTATNATGTSTAVTLTITVNPAKPVITSGTTASGQTGVAFSYQITASNSPTSFAASPLPAGVTVNTTSGLISGTPTAVGTTSVSLTATNAGGTSTAVTLTITVTLGKPVITSATTATGQVGTAFSYQITATNTPTSFAASPLPAGLSVSTTTGLISGTPTATGTTNVSLTATNATGTSAAVTLVITVNPAKPVITSATTASGQTGVAFSYQITASNSPTSFAASPLPAGVTVNTTGGLISGTPTATGTTNVTISATNAGGTGTKTLTITVTQPTAAAPTFSPGAGTYSSVQMVAISSTTSGASIAYTTDGSTPAESGGSVTHGTLYSASVSIGVTTTLKAIAFKTGFTDSTVTSGIYTINIPPVITSQPQITSFSPLYNFTGGNDGANPVVNLIQGTDGRLYGTTQAGGNGNGTVFAVNPDGTGFTTLYSFDGFDDGSDPQANLIQGTDGRLYGTANYGGANGPGTVFALNPDGTGFTVLHNFANGNDGAFPLACSLIQGTDGRLYGMANQGGTNGDGVVFAVNPDGTGFTTLYSFTNGNDGGDPDAGLVQGTDGRLYGTTPAGGSGNNGTLFGINTDGTGFALLYTFTGGNDAVGLIQGTDGRLYGTTQAAGNGYGTVFAINKNGAGFTTLYTFTGGNDGARPSASLVLGTGGQLYGTASQGGVDGDGTVFAINPDGNDFTVLYNFTDGSDGSNPLASLIQGTGGQLYGTANQGGANGDGTLFAISSQSTVTAGANVTFTVAATGVGSLSYQWKFNGSNISGATGATLTLTNVNTSNSGSYTVAVSNSGGSVTSNAVTLTVTVPSPPSAPVFAPAGGNYPNAQTVTITSAGAVKIYYTTDGSTPTTSSILYTNTGPVSISANTTLKAIGVNAGGSSPVAIATYMIGLPVITSQPQITSCFTLYSFTGGNDGGGPQANLIQGTDGRLYGTIQGGGANAGTVFAVNADGTGFTTLHGFTGGDDGAYPQAGLIQGTDGRLYGTTQNAGTNGNGTVFAINPDGTGFTTLCNFTGGNDGGNSSASLIQGTDGRLYGTSQAGGTNGDGVVFAVNPDGTGFTTLYNFTGGDDGGNPKSGLIQGTDGRLYGTTPAGGSGNNGTAFAIKTDGTGFALLYSFTGGNAGTSLLQGSNGQLYGITQAAGNGYGTVFSLNPDGSNFATLYTFTGGSDGAFPSQNLIQGTDGRLYGTTSQIGIGNGTVFALNPDGTGLTTLYTFTNGTDGNVPEAGLIQGTDGRLYGTASQGGVNGDGTLFAVSSQNTVTAGSTVTLTVAATGTALSYQWQFNGANISGATSATLTLSNVNSSNVGSYTLVVSNPAGSATSNPVTLTVTVSAPVFSPVPGTYVTNTQAVTITSATTGASIRYTTDGSTPTETNGTLYSGAVNLSATATLQAIAYKTGLTDSSITSGIYTIQAVAPVFSPAPGTYTTNTQAVTITSATTGATIRYTTDGSTPTETNGTLYSGAVNLSATTTLKAIAYENGLTDSSVTSGIYTIQAVAPTFSLSAGTYVGTQTVTISTVTSGASIRYTTNGSTPTETNGTLYSGAVSISATTTLKAIAYKTGLTDSSVTSGVYTIQTIAPVFSPAPGTYVTNTQAVTITSATTGATIRYTTDGSTPTETNGTIYTGAAVNISATMTLKAIAYETGLTDSSVTSGIYTIQTIGPIFSLAAGTYANAQTVTITSATTGASIRYTTDGSTPTETNGTVYSGTPVNISATTTLQAIAYKTGLTDSSITSAVYTLQAAAPVFSLAAGTYSNAQTVTITSATTGATIRYTTDGSTPTETNGTIYSGVPVNISGTTTLKAIAYENGYTDSGVTSVTYTLQAAAPVFSLAAGTYANAQTVTITSATTGATIRYTTDGSTPTETNGTVYTGTVNITATTTLKAIAYENGYTDSGVTSVTYTLQAAAPVFSLAAGTYANAQTVTITSATTGTTIRYTTDGSTPTETNGTVYTGTVNITATTTLKAIAYESGYTDSGVTSVTYTLQAAAPTFSSAPGGHAVMIVSATTGATIRYTTDGSTPTETNGTVYSSPVGISTAITLKAIAYESGYTDSLVTSVTIGIPTITITTPANGSTINN